MSAETLPGSQSSPELPTSPLHKSSVECTFLPWTVRLLHYQQEFAGVCPYLVTEHLLLVDMIVQGYRYPTVVALWEVQSGAQEPAIKIKCQQEPYLQPFPRSISQEDSRSY